MGYPLRGSELNNVEDKTRIRTRPSMALTISMLSTRNGTTSYLFKRGQPLMSTIQTCLSFSDDCDNTLHEDSSAFVERREQYSNSDRGRLDAKCSENGINKANSDWPRIPVTSTSIARTSVSLPVRWGRGPESNVHIRI